MILNRDFIFTSESVSEGHPDKICDQISDKILDLYLEKDENAHVACECFITSNHLIIAGEISSQANISKDTIEFAARKLIKDIGYTSPEYGFSADNANINILLHEQSTDIAQGVKGGIGLHKEEGAGDQGLMFGFAINETKEYMPAPIYYAHKILEELSILRKKNTIEYLLPDAKSQVSFLYKNGKPYSIQRIVLSTQHKEGTPHKLIEEDVIESCIKKVIPQNFLQDCQFFINPTGNFVIGGPHGDCGLTGRKIIVDTYGGMARHGGGAFSGKDPSKVDRSAAYMMRYIAKNIVASHLADVCEIQVAYAIGVAKPMSLMVNTYGTGKTSDAEIGNILMDSFDITPKGIRETLNLRKIPYLPTASYGHFGRKGAHFTWENLDRISIFQ